MLTESRNPSTTEIDGLATLEILRLMNAEDATVPGAVAQALPHIAQAVELIVERLRAGGRLFYVGAGTSGRLAVLDAAECVPTFSTAPEQVQAIIAGGAPAMLHSIEGAEDDYEQGRADLLARALTPQDVVVGIAASGRTPYVLGALAAAAEAGAGTVGIACNQPAPVLEAAQVRIAALVGPEVITGSTRLKAGTAQKLILNMISTATMIRLGKVYGNLMVDVKVSNRKLAERARRIITEVTGISDEAAADLLAQTNHEVKTAIMVALLGISPQAARARLDAAQGVLRAALAQG
jgi:N-acetylmuramic acid 6-phosphate etherase